MMISQLLTACLVTTVVFAADANQHANMTILDNIHLPALTAQGWIAKRAPHPEERLTLQIGLKLSGEEEVIAKLRDVSDPASPNYGKWLDRDEVIKLAQPNLDPAKKVTRWLKDAGVSTMSTSEDGQWITFETAVSHANHLLRADFRQFEKRGVSKIRTAACSVPQDVVDSIDLIHPTTFFGEAQAFQPPHTDLDSWMSDNTAYGKTGAPRIKRSKSQLSDPLSHQTLNDTCRFKITPKCLKEMYNVGDYQADPKSGSKIGFTSFLDQTSRLLDSRLFIKEFDIHDREIRKVYIHNASDDQSQQAPHEKANLNAQYTLAVADPLPVIELMTGGFPPIISDGDTNDGRMNTNEPYVPYLQYLLHKTNAVLPQVISNSYSEPERTVPRNYAARTCLMFAMLGLRGVTVIQASGDSGVGTSCQANDGTLSHEFDPQFPGTCPWVTSVGGTEAIPAIAWSYSSGGFSNYFNRPWYQNEAVEIYLNERLPRAVRYYYQRYFFGFGRGFPDVSAHALTPYYHVIMNSAESVSGGTPAAATVWAGLIALLNDARRKAQLPTLGFINPWLYTHGPDGFLLDVQRGKSIGCLGVNPKTGLNYYWPAVIPWASWNATEGWDPATGLGIPNFRRMLDSVAKPP